MIKAQKMFEFYRTLIAIALALLVSLVVILLISDVPGEAITLLFVGPFRSLRHFGNVFELLIPLIFTGLAFAVIFTASQINLAVEGAFFFGAAGAAFVAINWALPPFIHPVVTILYGGVLGGIVCAIPGLLKVKWGSSELVSSLMINYIVYFLGLYLINYFLRDVDAGFVVSYLLPESVKLARIVPKTRVHAGLIVAVLMVVLVTLFLYRTKWGYRIRVMGSNPAFARYAGINIASYVVLSQVIGGFLAGMGGTVEVLGLYRRFTWQTLPGYGWEGLIVAILARNHPAYVPLAAFFLAYFSVGADIMSRYTDVPNEFVVVVQGVLILFIAAERFLGKYRHKIVLREAMGE